jgi:hypothetical protein
VKKSCLSLSTTLLLLNCQSTTNKKENSPPLTKQTVCQHKAIEEIENEQGPFPSSLQCKEGFSIQKTSTGKEYKTFIDCKTAGTLFDKDKKYLKLFEEKCPTEGIIATCKGETFTVYLYQSDLSTDIDHFTRYCEEMQGKLD